jgi:hypothetical protein
MGRPRSKDPLIFKSIGLTASQWEWLQLWFPTGNVTDQLKALHERAVKFWPSGPNRFK